MVDTIIDAVIEVYNINKSDLLSRSRKGTLPEARRMVAYFMLTNGYSVPDIMATLNQGNTIVYKAIQKTLFDIKIYKTVKERFEKIEAIINKTK